MALAIVWIARNSAPRLMGMVVQRVVACAAPAGLRQWVIADKC